MSRAPRIPEHVVEAAHRRYVAGERSSTLAKAFGVSQSGLNSAFRNRGLWLRPKGDTTYWTKAKTTAAHRRYLAGERAEDLAGEQGKTGAGLLCAFRRHGLRALPPHRPVGRRAFDNKPARGHECIPFDGVCLGCDKPMEATQVA